MPGDLILLVVAALVSILLVYLAVLEVRAERKAFRERAEAAIKHEANAAIGRLDASYWQAVRDMRR